MVTASISPCATSSDRDQCIGDPAGPATRRSDRIHGPNAIPGASTVALLELCHVSRSFESGRIAALTDVSVAIGRGQSIAICGPSGSGKSTLVNMMCGLDIPDAGHVSFAGRVVTSARDWTRLRRDRIGVVFQHFHLLPTLDAAENVEAAMMRRVPDAKQRAQRAQFLLHQVGLSDRATSRPADLSGGERQRVALARALANGPDVILADEPTGSLDQANGKRVLELLTTLVRESGAALVVITHDAQVAGHCDTRIELLDGRIVSARNPASDCEQERLRCTC